MSVFLYTGKVKSIECDSSVCRDNVPHVPDSELNPHKMFTVVKTVTDLLLETFPSTPFYPTIGNHDSWPANQVPPGDYEQYYSQIAGYAGWHNMLDEESLETFKKGEFS